MDDQAIREAPQRRILQGLLSRADSMERRLDSPGQHGPAGRRPMSLCVTWGPIGLQTPRRAGSAGFEFLAPLVSPGVYLIPNYPTPMNPFVAVPGSFIWCSTHVSAELCWTYTYIPRIINTDVTAMVLNGALSAVATTVPVVSVPGPAPASGVILIDQEQISYAAKTGVSFTGCVRGVNGTAATTHVDTSVVRVLSTLTAPVAGIPQGSLFDAAIQNNGGAIILNNFAGTQQFAGAPVHPRICVELDLIDKTRARTLTGGRVPIEAFCSGSYGFKKLPKRMRFQHGTEIEPRLYVNECRMMSILDETAVFTAASVAVYVSMVFKGYTVRPRVYTSMGGP